VVDKGRHFDAIVATVEVGAGIEAVDRHRRFLAIDKVDYCFLVGYNSERDLAPITLR
jgi:hypothetical protein